MTRRIDISKSLIDCLQEVSSLLEHAKDIATKQQNALVKNDAEMIVLTTRAQEGVLRRVNEADQRAAAIGIQLLEAVELDTENADSETIANAAGHPYSDLIKLEMKRISELSADVKMENEICAALLKNGLDIIVCCLRTLANDPGPNAYGPSASMSEQKAVVLSLDRRA